MDNNIFNEFNKYVKKFDLKEKANMYKFHHTYRVVEYASAIACSLGLSEDEIYTAKMCALLHDIARFKQYTEYKTFNDMKSFDHGDMACEILLEDNLIDKFTKDEETKKIVLCSVRNHNKKEIEDDLSSKELLFTNIVRDADKLDIMIEQCNKINDGSTTINDNALKDLKEHRLCDNKDIHNHCDNIIRMLSFIFDINFKYTFKFMLDKKIIENKIHLLSVYTLDNRLESLEKDLKQYAEEMILC